jgi:hypothetical protein
MIGAPADPERRAARLLRWYPGGWRARYGDEFAELLVAEMAERPRSWRRDANVAWSGVVARLTGAGLTDHAGDPAVAARASLATLGCAAGAFLAVGVAIWSQLTIGWRWAEPSTGATYAAMLCMSFAMLALCALALAAAVPVVCAVAARIARSRPPGLVGPVLATLAAGAFLALGSRHFGHGWPGTGGHPWAQQHLVPAGVASFLWASTLSVTSYWAHPGALRSFPAAELAWMASSPLAIVGVVAGSARTLRRVELSGRVLRYEAGVARVAALAMWAFLAGAAAWVVDGGPGPRDLFHTGAIDVAGLVVMGLALAVAHRAVYRARTGSLALLGR